MANQIYPVIRSGSSGTRLWLMSRRLLPKHFLPLRSERAMLQDTLLRLTGRAGMLGDRVAFQFVKHGASAWPMHKE